VRNKLRKRQYENEVLRLVDVDVARAAGTAPVAVAVHIASAWEIATEMQLAVGVGARRPPLMRRAPPRRESAPYFVGPRCVFVCVCVCVCVFVCVLSSRCLVCRPSYFSVCAVSRHPSGALINITAPKELPDGATPDCFRPVRPSLRFCTGVPN